MMGYLGIVVGILLLGVAAAWLHALLSANKTAEERQADLDEQERVLRANLDALKAQADVRRQMRDAGVREFRRRRMS